MNEAVFWRMEAERYRRQPATADGALRVKVTVEREDGTELHFFYPLDRPVRFGDRVVLEFTVGHVETA